MGADLVTSVPIALAVQSLLSCSGHDSLIADPVFKSATFELVEGIKMGIVGSTSGYAIRRFFDWI